MFQLLDKDYSICRTPKSYNSQLGVSISVLQLRESHQLGIFEASTTKKGELNILNNIIEPTIGVRCKIENSTLDNRDLIEEFSAFFEGTKDIISNKTNLKGKYNYPFKDKPSVENCKLCIAVLEHLNIPENEIQERINKVSKLMWIVFHYMCLLS